MVYAKDVNVATPSDIYALSHDSFADFLANEHLDWTSDLGSTNIDSNNLSWTDGETALEAVLDLQDLQGAVTDGQVPNTITIDLATLATTVTITDDESSNDDQEVLFTTDNANVESDGDFTYNPSQGRVDVNGVAVGGATNYVDINDTGMTLYGDARVYKNEWIDASSFRIPTLNPATATEHGISFCYDFTDGKDDIVFANMRIPQGIDRTVDPELKIGWCTTDVNTVNYCTWQLEYLYLTAGEDAEVAAQETLSVNSNAIATEDGLIIATITGMDTLAAGDQLIMFRVTRLGTADTLEEDAHFLGMGIKYTANKLGTGL